MSEPTVEMLQERIKELETKLEQAELLRDTMKQMVASINQNTANFFQKLWDAAKTEDGYFRKTIWYMWKPGDARDFASTRPPAPEWAESCKKEGYFIVSFEIKVPDAASSNLGVVGYIDEGDATATRGKSLVG